MITIKIMINI